MPETLPTRPDEDAARQPLSDTAERILDIAQDLIQRRGFNAFSYHDIAAPMGIRKASIHYHFPGKADLGQAVIARYRRNLAALMREAEIGNADHWTILAAYFHPYFEFARTGDKVCLCGALAGEFMALSADMQAQVSAFFRDHQDWLATLFARGRAAGAFAFAGSPGRMARAVFSALQGGLMVERATGDRRHLRETVAILEATLRGPA